MRRKLPLSEEHGQGLVEYALILILAAVLVIISLALMGTSIEATYCRIIGQLPFGGDSCDEDVVVVTRADYDNGTGELHLDATSDGDYHADVILTASPGGVMEARAHHYHLDVPLSGCPCEVTVTSSQGGSASVFVGP